MEKNEKIELLIRKTLNRLESPETLPPNPWLFEQVHQKLESRNSSRSMFHDRVKPALLTVLVLSNLVVTYLYFTGNAQRSRSIAHREIIELLSTEFGLAGSRTAPLIIE